MTWNSRQKLRPSRRASVLLLVLVAIVIMTLTTSSYLLLMRNEHIASRYSGNHLQAEMLARSGIDYLRTFLSQTPSEVELQGGLLSNPSSLQDVLVLDDELPNYRGRFTVVTADQVQGYYQNIRYGLENESTKLNLNSLLASESESGGSGGAGGGGAAGGGAGAGASGGLGESSQAEEILSPHDRLMLIPGMNDEVADAILDWLDEDDDARTYGAEADHYQSLATPYLPANGPIKNLDELLLVRGVTPELLYGLDVNRNFQVDADEQPTGALAELDNTNGQLNRGWSAYLTVHSYKANLDPDGEAKINVNDSELQTLHGELVTGLGQAEANFIIAFRQFGAADASSSSSGPGVSVGGGGGSPQSAESITINFDTEAQNEIASLLDLVDARVSVQGEQGQPAQLIESPWTSEPGILSTTFAELQDAATSESGEVTAGQININQASMPVLMTIPGMTEVAANQILAARDPAVDLVAGEQRHPSWLLADGIFELEDFKPMFPLLTTGGDVFSCQVVGFFDAGTARTRLRVLIDRSGDTAKLLRCQDLSQLGPGFSRSVLTTFVPEQP